MLAIAKSFADFRTAYSRSIPALYQQTGSLYALAVTGVRMLGAITPVGGLAFIIGWLVLVYELFRVKTT